LVIKGLQDAEKANERIEQKLHEMGEELDEVSGRPAMMLTAREQDVLIAEHKQMWQWFGLAKIVVPLIGGAVFTIAVAYSRQFIGI
jgi:hypothetical protein